MKIFQICIGPIAHIGPLGTIEFALDFRIIGLCRRGDVGIAPYEPYGRFQNNCRGGRPCPPLGTDGFAADFRNIGSFCRDDVGIVPYKSYGSFRPKVVGADDSVRPREATNSPKCCAFRRHILPGGQSRPPLRFF